MYIEFPMQSEEIKRLNTNSIKFKFSTKFYVQCELLAIVTLNIFEARNKDSF